MSIPNRGPHGKPWVLPRPHEAPARPAGRTHWVRRWPVVPALRSKEEPDEG